MPKVNVTCRMDEERVASLDKLGEFFDRERSYLINQAVDRFLRYHQWQLQEVEKAAAEADLGDLLTEEQLDDKMNRGDA